MYVKIISGDRRRSATVYATDDQQPIDFGRERVKSNPSEMKWDELTAALGVAGDSMDRTQVGSEPTAYLDEPYWEVGWVRFRKPGLDAVHLVAATSPIYLLDHSGKTIDRV